MTLNGLAVILLLMIGFEGICQQQDSIKLSETYQAALKEYHTFEEQHRHYHTTKNIRLSYLDWGDNNNKDRVFVWLHGSLSNAWEFAPFAEQLVDRGYRVISIDQYNSGKTPLPPFDASFDDLCQDIKSVLDSLEISSVILGGFSRGGFLATNFYKLHPTYVKGLFLEDGGSAAFHTSYFKLNSKELRRKLAEVNTPKEIEEQYFGIYDNRFEAFKSLYNTQDNGNQPELFSFIRPYQEKWVTYRGQSEYYHMQDSLHMAEVLFASPNVSRYASSIVQVDPLAIFQNLGIPILLLDPISDQDPIPVYEENKLLAAAHPQWITHIVVNNVEHNVHYTEPQIFIREMMNFLKQIHLENID